MKSLREQMKEMPVASKLRYVQGAWQREKESRLRYFKGAIQKEKVAEADIALDCLDAIAAALNGGPHD